MSDQSQGPGWWQASDLKWYPPDQVPGTGSGSTGSEGSGWGAPGTGSTGPAWGAAPPAAAPPPAWGAPPPGGPGPYPPPGGYGGGQPPSYGVPGWSPYGAYAGGPRLPSVNGLAAAALVLGIIGLVTFFCFFVTLPLSVAGLICGGIALSRIGNGTADPDSRGLALGGTITSGIALAGGLVVLLALAAG